MSRDDLPVVFVVGPAGAGKSTVAAWTAEDFGFLHLEIDRYPHGDGIDLERLRDEWDVFWLEKDAGPIAAVLRERAAAAGTTGVVASFPCGVVPGEEQLASLSREDVTLVVLYGTAADCIQAYLRRERTSGSGMGVDHWIRYNEGPYAQLSRPRFGAHRLVVFADGAFRGRLEIVEEVAARLGRKTTGGS